MTIFGGINNIGQIKSKDGLDEQIKLTLTDETEIQRPLLGHFRSDTVIAEYAVVHYAHFKFAVGNLSQMFGELLAAKRVVIVGAASVG